MNLKQALYIQTIAREGGVTAAAKKLYISQPSLSQMLRQIESELGVPLFERGSLPLRPTYAGERYLHAAQVILSANEALENELREIRQENGGRLRLGISMQRSAHLLPRVLPGFSKAYPNVRLELREGGSALLERLVLEGQVDLALATTESSAPGISYELIQRETIGILAGADSPLARRLPPGTPIQLEQAADCSFVSLKQGHNIRVIQDRLFQAQGLQPSIFLETDSMEAARQMTVQCGCCMLCSDSYPMGTRSAFYPLEGYENHRHFYACSRTDHPLPRYVADFIHMVRESMLQH